MFGGRVGFERINGQGFFFGAVKGLYFSLTFNIFTSVGVIFLKFVESIVLRSEHFSKDGDLCTIGFMVIIFNPEIFLFFHKSLKNTITKKAINPGLNKNYITLMINKKIITQNK